MDLVLIRHPAVAVEAGVCYGRSDVPLAGDADAGAVEIARRLAAIGAAAAAGDVSPAGCGDIAQALTTGDLASPLRIVTSPLARCSSVAERLASMHGLAAQYDDRFAEIDFGAWELCAWEAIARGQVDAWAADFLHAREHGGESVVQFDARVQAGLDAWVGVPGAPSMTWIVTHAGVIRAMTARALGVPLSNCMRWTLEMAAIVWLRREAVGGEWRLVRWNV
ncbi:histidine phosphatase family protein [Paraburkholderia caballeronis]|uniref:Alpha-ribazole phosphatase n=1 Tax=Paraburkholderia caballeronis TaxID=416943 RepID=A0A1H7R8D1_9BURK|nr:histidine phosphatase family protein [Paraburkholderia caballeronis]PXW23595.1 alpha-ribazole phosphatase [Paraburkholderia caballeronis]PXW98936.1 alpha-ribazole phosphatase [Paraburkholderia caballeronis]RAJ96142.1 alpha-ribazole phosphatase [Paraburkholderia caballeronis]SEC78657.1 alpha-ribazole phosphatase [Paraburkholderia caballeronis]SEL56546.1 alpha-ribazole phosphatase [Paraburkholderia caballeronis]